MPVSLFTALVTLTTFLATLPSTTNYSLNSYGFGSGGTAGTNTSNYTLEGISGELNGNTTSSSNYRLEPGYIETQQANVPKITLSNPSNFYDKLKFVIDTQNNPNDALYALQVSTTSNFSSNVNYVQPNLTLTATLTTSDYQKFSTWGGASGNNIIGLASNTTYFIRAKATQGLYTESAYGPSSSVATVGQQFSFCLYTSATCAGAGTSVSFSNIAAGTITNGSSTIKTDFATNADSGGNVYVYSTNGGLKSPSASNYLISLSASQVDLGAVSEGFGAQATGTQSTGGPLSPVSPYNGSSNTVGKLLTTINALLSSTSPLTGGTGTTTLKLLAANTTPSANDYADKLTFIAAASF